MRYRFPEKCPGFIQTELRTLFHGFQRQNWVLFRTSYNFYIIVSMQNITSCCYWWLAELSYWLLLIFCPKNLGSWQGPANGTLSFCECSWGHSNPTCCNWIHLNLFALRGCLGAKHLAHICSCSLHCGCPKKPPGESFITQYFKSTVNRSSSLKTAIYNNLFLQLCHIFFQKYWALQF